MFQNMLGKQKHRRQCLKLLSAYSFYQINPLDNLTSPLTPKFILYVSTHKSLSYLSCEYLFIYKCPCCHCSNQFSWRQHRTICLCRVFPVILCHFNIPRASQSLVSGAPGHGSHLGSHESFVPKFY